MLSEPLYKGNLPIWINEIQVGSSDVYMQSRTITVIMEEASAWMYQIGDIFPLPLRGRPQMCISSIQSTHRFGRTQWTLSGNEC